MNYWKLNEEDNWKNFFDKNQVEAVLLSDQYTIRYSTGYTGDTGKVFVSKSKRVILTDSRYITQAKEETKDWEIVEINKNLSYAMAIASLLEDTRVTALGFEEKNISYYEFTQFQEKIEKVIWVPISTYLDRIRSIKTENEILLLAKAEEIGDMAFQHILNFLRVGVSELDVAAEIEYFMKKNGATKLSFDTIVASGENSAKPHAVPSHKELEKGDFVTMDFGCVYEGYCSDMTRTIVIGQADERQKEIYNLVLSAQQAALEEIKAGLTGAQVDKVARDKIAAAGYGEYFGHGLGHSVGLYIHEEPRLSPAETTVLEENMIETVEPGIYIPDFGGVRIEDMVVVKKDGCQNLTNSYKELIEI